MKIKIKIIIGFVVSFFIGFFCNLSGVPLPAPPIIQGSVLVLSMTIGYLVTNEIIKRLKK